MSEPLRIIPYPTVNGIGRAIAAKEGGFELAVKYIGVGKGKQTIALDAAGRATTEKLKDLVGYIEVLAAKKINGNQWQLAIDLKQVETALVEWDFAEFILCDANKQTIAIYGNATQALFTVTPYLKNALLAANLLLATFPADSIVIEHHNLPLNLFFDKEFKAVHDAMASNNLDILRHDEDIQTKANASDFGIVAASQALSDQLFNQMTMQAGILSARQYNYHGAEDGIERHVWDRGYNPADSHNHSNYDRMSGQAEVVVITPSGGFAVIAHSDYRHKQTSTGNQLASSYLATEDVPLPRVPSSVTNAGNLDAQIAAMRDLYVRYNKGEFPEGFKFIGVGIEEFIEPFTGTASGATDSFRHSVAVTGATKQLSLNQKYLATGLKDRFENLPFNQVFCTGFDGNGKPQLAIRRQRFICCDLSALGDLRPYIESVDDPVMDEYRGITQERFKITESQNRPGKLDDIAEQFWGLDGPNAYLEETHLRNGQITKVTRFGTREVLNAARYYRWGSTVEADASNRNDYKTGFNSPNYFKALNTRPEILPSVHEGTVHRVSTLMLYEVILYHPAMGWNPLNLSVNATPNAGGRNGTVAAPYAGINPNAYWYFTPDAFFSGAASGDRADTGAGTQWALGPNNVAHPVRSSGIFITLPPIAGVGTIRQRYPIYTRPQDASYEVALSKAYQKRNLRLFDKLTAELTNIYTDQVRST